MDDQDNMWVSDRGDRIALTVFHRRGSIGGRRCDLLRRCHEGGLAPSIHLAAGQFAIRARYGAARRFSQAPDGIRMAFGLLDFVEPIVVHSEFLGWLATRQK